MAWEKRGDGTYYYYSYRGPDGRPRKKYLGQGQEARVTDQHIAMVRARREADRHAAAEFLQNIKGIEEEGRQLDQDVAALVELHLLASGHHKHHGQWRRSRRRPDTYERPRCHEDQEDQAAT